MNAITNKTYNRIVQRKKTGLKMKSITLLLLLPAAWSENLVRLDNSHLPGWLRARVQTKSTDRNNCQYSCSDGGGCSVQYRGYELGRCEPSGACVGTPKQCQDCNQAIKCPKIEEAVHLGGCFGPEEEKFPRYWIPLLEDPCSQLKGPKCPCNPMPKAEKIGIVGAGMAGLTMAWILQSIGHEVTILEATDRVGGRAFTYHGDGWYGDLGAMRFPPKRDQPLIHQLFKQFNIPLADFTNTNQGTSSYYHVNGKYFSSKSYEENDQKVLKEVYETFGINTNVQNGTFPRFLNGSLKNPSSDFLLADHIPTNVTQMCLNDETLNQVFEKGLEETSLPKKLIPLWSVLELQRAFLHKSAYQAFHDTPQEHERRAYEENEQFKEVVGGTSVLPEKIKNIITSHNSFEKVDIQLNSSVDHIKIDKNKKVIIEYEKDGNRYLDEFKKVILTPTSRVVSSMTFSPRLAYNKAYALDSFHFIDSVKVFLAFHTPFWANKTKIPAIPFDSHTTNGGSGITDLPIRSIYYPSHPFHGYSILVSYVWGQDADRLTALSNDDLILEALTNLVEIHGEVARTNFKEGKVQKWMEQSWTAGAFPWAYPGQFRELLGTLQQSHMEKVFFAGEYTSKFDHGWIQAAIESACRVSHSMFGRDEDDECK